MPDKHNTAEVWHFPQFDDATLLHADYSTQHFGPHFHAEYSVGVITRGRLITRIGHADTTTIGPGQLVLINPNETHIGHADPAQGCAYRMWYLPVSLVRNVLTHTPKTPVFAACAVGDGALASQLAQLHQTLTTTTATSLAHEAALFDALHRLMARCSRTSAIDAREGKADQQLIHHAQAFLEAHCHEHVSLDALAELTHLSKWHFLREFRRATGLAPHAFQLQMRIDKAKPRLLAGEPVSHIALDLGFHDQTHFTKQFRRLAGITPDRFRQHRNFLPNNAGQTL